MSFLHSAIPVAKSLAPLIPMSLYLIIHFRIKLRQVHLLAINIIIYSRLSLRLVSCKHFEIPKAKCLTLSSLMLLKLLVVGERAK